MGKAKILVIDDEKLVVDGIKMELEDGGEYDVRTTTSPQKGIDMAEKEKMDIVYVDLVMPVINGVEVCRAIKKASPGTEVVLISGHYDEILKFREDFWKAGGRDEILRKPFVLESEVLAVTEKILKEGKEA